MAVAQGVQFAFLIHCLVFAQQIDSSPSGSNILVLYVQVATNHSQISDCVKSGLIPI